MASKAEAKTAATKPSDPTPAASPKAEAPAAPTAAEQLKAPTDTEVLYVLGEVTWLMTRSAKHRHVFMADLEWLLLPPLVLKQARIFRHKPEQPPADAPAGAIGTPLAFASWAFVSDEVDARLKLGIGKLKPGEWRSGTHPWIVDVLAPFGGGDKVVAELVREVFGGKAVPVLGGVQMAAARASAEDRS